MTAPSPLVVGVGQVWRDPLGRMWVVRDVDAVRGVAGLRLGPHALVVASGILPSPHSGWLLEYDGDTVVKGEVVAHLCRQRDARAAS